jgi:hypothetical protein
MIHNPELFDTREREYDTATWLSILPIMERIGNSYADRTNYLTGMGRHALTICTSFGQKPDHFRMNIQQWISEGRIDKTRVNAMKNLDIINRNEVLNLEFNDAYDIFIDHGLQTYLRTNSSFGELIPLADELVGHFEPKVHKTIEEQKDLLFTLASVKHDIGFYIGQYDPRR